MDFLNYLQVCRQEISEELDQFFQEWSKEVRRISPQLISLNLAFQQACQGGKRLRGTLVKLGYEMAGNRPNPEILKASIAYEIFQTAILAHDDIIDKSDLRRGKPTLWKILGGNHYGISQTICLGDIGFFLAQKLITESKFPDNLKNKAVSSFVDTVLNTALGEVLDIEEGDFKEKDILTIFSLKTAKYTIVGPMQLGAILGGTGPKLLTEMQKFGEKLGIAFQIQDDILGVFGEEKVVGKPITSDIEEGKNTLLIIEALKKANSKQKKVLHQFYGKGKIGQMELEAVRKIFQETKALKYSQNFAAKLVEEAKATISQMEISRQQKNLLTQMADFLVKREK